MPKGRIIVLVLLFGTAFCAVADTLFTDLPGSYVIYNDERFDDQAFIGLLYLGDDTLLVRTYEGNSDLEFALVLKLNVLEGEVTLGEGMEILAGKLTDSDTTRRILPMLLNWGNAWIQCKDDIGSCHSCVREYDDLYSYQYWIPLFNMESIENDPDFTLLTVGIVQDINDPAFAQFAGIPESSKSDSFKILVGNTEKTYVPRLDLSLDNNWIEGDDGIFRIQMKTIQDAALFVEEIGLEGTPFSTDYDIAKFLMLVNSGGILLADESQIYSSGDRVVLENRVLDPRTGAVSYQKKRIIQEENLVSILSFASFLDLYNENISYFNDLLDQ